MSPSARPVSDAMDRDEDDREAAEHEALLELARIEFEKEQVVLEWDEWNQSIEAAASDLKE